MKPQGWSNERGTELVADIEKVIKGLECCMKWEGENTARCNCSDCSYTNMDILGKRCLIDLINDALELLDAKEPILLTLDEVANAKYPTDIFCEIKDDNRVFAVTAPVPERWIWANGIRYWTARPTEEQRKAEPWKDGVSE